MAAPYVTGGGGIRFETTVAAYYLCAVLAQSPARCLLGSSATAVRMQRGLLGQPLDDLIVSGEHPTGEETTLHLQVKTQLAFTANDSDWQSVVIEAWQTINQATFDSTNHRVGAALSVYNAKIDRNYQSVLAWAAQSDSGEDFVARIAQPDFSNETKRKFVDQCATILSGHLERPSTDEEIWRLLRVFVIVHFDFQTNDASRDAVHARSQLAHLLDVQAATSAEDLWAHLVFQAGAINESGGSTDYKSVTKFLESKGIQLGPDRSYRKDIQLIQLESERAIAGIRSDINGLILHRDVGYQQVREALTTSRFVQIDGVPGCGKSALLKAVASEAQLQGPVFFLKDYRIQPHGWSAHASVLGVSANLVGLFQAIAASGTATLFIDGIDRLTDPASQLTLNDLIRAIATEPSLVHWRILTTARSQNLQYIDTWLDPVALQQLSFQNVDVQPLNSEELNTVTSHFPALKTLSLEGGPSDDLLRYPFFIATTLELSHNVDSELPVTEVDLFKQWWRLGGLEQSTPANTQRRRNALIQLAEISIDSSRNGLSVGNIDPEPIEELKSCGVLRDREIGHSVEFKHDIFAEWAQCHWLIRQDSDVGALLKQRDEPLVLVRPVQLLGTFHLEENTTSETWYELYQSVDKPKLKGVWARAVLSAGLHSTQSTLLFTKLAPLLLDKPFDLLGKLLQQLHTVEVLPNTKYLKSGAFDQISMSDRIAAARFYSIPKALLWVRFLDWLVPNLSVETLELVPSLVEPLTLWQREFGGERVRHCSQIAELSEQWLSSFEDADRSVSFRERAQPLSLDLRYEESERLEKNIRALFLMSVNSDAARIKSYLSVAPERVADQHRLRTQVIDQSHSLIGFAPTELVDFLLRAYLRDLDTNKYFSSYDRLHHSEGIDDFHDFYPASPLRLPFAGLLDHAEAEGLRLVHALCNHVVTDWRHCQTHDIENPLTPIPVRVSLPWGEQEFWGDGHVYLWFRGIWGPDMVKSACMALERWALAQLDSGVELGEVLAKVLKGNHSVAVLGVAVSLCLSDVRRSVNYSLPFVTTAHLWDWDIARSVTDSSGSISNTLANWQQHSHLLNGVKALNEMPHRKRSIRDLIPALAFHADPSIREVYTTGVRSFTEELPFSYEEQATDATAHQQMLKRMTLYAEQADPKYWVSQPTKDGEGFYVWNDPPTLKKTEYVEQRADHAALETNMSLAMWSQRSFENGSIADGRAMDEAIVKAQELDADDLFDTYGVDEELHSQMRINAVAGVASVMARFASESTLEVHETWCLSVLDRASGVVEAQDVFNVRASVSVFHPAVFAARGYSALLVRGTEVDRCKEALLYLGLDAVEIVAAAVYENVDRYASLEPEFYWSMFSVAVAQCIAPYDDLREYNRTCWGYQESRRKVRLIDQVLENLTLKTDATLPAIPLPWVHTAMLHDGGHYDTAGYERNADAWLFQLPKHTFFKFDIEYLICSPHRPAILRLLEQLLEEVIQQIQPPFVDRAQDYDGNSPYEWISEFGAWCGSVCTFLTHDEVQRIVIQRLETCSEDVKWRITADVMRSIMLRGLAGKKTLPAELIKTWSSLTSSVFNHPELASTSRDSYLSSELLDCAHSTLFCGQIGMAELVCVVDPGWSVLHQFQDIVETATMRFSTKSSLFYALTVFYGAGGADLLPTPALPWLRDAVLTNRVNTIFWRENGEAAVALLEQLVESKSSRLTATHREDITQITDVLVDNGVRSAGFLQQELLRQNY